MRARASSILLALSLTAILAALASCGGGGGEGSSGGAGGSLVLAVTTSSLPGATVSTAYNASLSAVYGTAPYSWSWAAAPASSLPAGLTCNAGGTITGTPSAPGTHSVVVTVTDSVSATANRTLTLNIGSSVIPPGTSVTTISVSNTVRLAGAKKLGINLGGRSQWGAA